MDLFRMPDNGKGLIEVKVQRFVIKDKTAPGIWEDIPEQEEDRFRIVIGGETVFEITAPEDTKDICIGIRTPEGFISVHPVAGNTIWIENLKG